MNKFHKLFNVKPAHFKDGWAFFDQIDKHTIQQAMAMGGKFVPNGSFIKIVLLLKVFPELMVFGRVHETSMDIKLEGLVGFVLDGKSTSPLNWFFPDVEKKKVTTNYVYVDVS
jgi:hypothetical protein